MATHYQDKDALRTLNGQLYRQLYNKPTQPIFVCIGTDRATGDCLGPYVGMLLESMGYNVRGTLDNPVHASNLVHIIDNLPTDKTIIAIDAALGKEHEIGNIGIRNGSISPGADVGKLLPSIGDISIIGVVNVAGFMEHIVLQTTRLSKIINMAKLIVNTIDLTMKQIYMPEAAVTEESVEND
jgi:putative sporulation protein YyaC